MSYYEPEYIYNATVKYPEGETIEYKQGFHLDNRNLLVSYAKTLCAFCNTNGGKLVFGITDKGVCVGIHKENVHELDTVNQLFVSLCSTLLKPQINIKYNIYRIEDKSFVVSFEVEKANCNVYYHSKMYVRQMCCNIAVKPFHIYTNEEKEKAISEIKFLTDEHGLKMRQLRGILDGVRTENKQLKRKNEMLEQMYSEKQHSSNILTIICNFFSIFTLSK